MFTDFEVEVLENESDVITNFQVELPKESLAAEKRAAKLFSKEELFELVGDAKPILNSTILDENKIDSEITFEFGVGLTKNFDFSKLPLMNKEWIGEPLFLATEEDLLFSNFFIEGEQNEETRKFRKNRKEQEEFDED
jgi:hypothetical protein